MLLALIGRTARALALAPLGFGARQWFLTSVFTAAVGAAAVKERAVEALFQTHAPTLVTSAITALGGGEATTIYVLAFLACGRLRNDKKLTRAGHVMGAAGACGLVLTLVGQFVLAEARPIDGGGMHLFALGGHGVSGHAAAVSLVAVTLSRVLGRDLAPSKRRALAASAFSWAAIVAVSRIYLGMHFAWNVLLGLGVGISVASVAVKESEKG